jgi:enolase
VAKKTPKKAAKKATKKPPAKKSVRKAAAKASAYPPGRKIISLHQIVAEIDKALSELDKTRTRSIEGGNKVAAARLSLSAARDAVESACVPNFDFPEPS